MVILESSFLIDVLRNNSRAVQLIDEIERKEPKIFIAAPTVMELWEGALKSKVPNKEKEQVEALLATVPVLTLDARTAKCAAEVEVQLSLKGTAIETEDVMIAGIALAHGETVVTKDAHYTRIPGLKVLKY